MVVVVVFLDFEAKAWSGVELDGGLFLGCPDFVHFFGVFGDLQKVVRGVTIIEKVLEATSFR